MLLIIAPYARARWGMFRAYSVFAHGDSPGSVRLSGDVTICLVGIVLNWQFIKVILRTYKIPSYASGVDWHRVPWDCRFPSGG